MKKSLVIIALIILISAAYTGFWWYKSNELKQRFEENLDKFSEQESNRFIFKYETLERRGFPFTVELVLKNPQIIDRNNLIKISHEGTATVGSSIFERGKVWEELSGKTDIMVAQNTGNPQHILISGTSYFACHFCRESNALLLEGLQHPEIFLKWLPQILRDSTVKLKDFKISKATKEEPTKFFTILSLKEGVFNFKNADNEGMHNFSIDTNIEKMTYTDPKSIDDLHSLFPNSDKEELRKAFLDLGSFDLTFAAHGSIPTFDNPFYHKPSLENMPNFSFVIDQSKYTSELDTHISRGQVEYENLPESKFKAILSLIQQWKATEKLHDKVVNIVDVIAKNNAEKANTSGQDKELEKMILAQSNDLVPDFSQFGTVEFQINSESNGKKGIGPNSIAEAVLELKLLKLSCDLYGISISGKFEKKPSSEYSSFADIQMVNYKNLFRDMANYYNKWQKILVESKTTTSQNMPMISQAFVDRFVQFLESFSTHKESNTLDIPIYFEDKDHIKIGTQSYNDAAAAWSQTRADLKSEILKANPPPKEEAPKEEQKAA